LYIKNVFKLTKLKFSVCAHKKSKKNQQKVMGKRARASMRQKKYSEQDIVLRATSQKL